MQRKTHWSIWLAGFLLALIVGSVYYSKLKPREINFISDRTLILSQLRDTNVRIPSQLGEIDLSKEADAVVVAVPVKGSAGCKLAFYLFPSGGFTHEYWVTGHFEDPAQACPARLPEAADARKLLKVALRQVRDHLATSHTQVRHRGFA